MSEKRFEITEYGSDYYIEIIDNEKELDESIHNPSQKLSLIECVDLLNELNDENDVLKQQLQTRYIVNKQYEELQRLKKENNELKKQVEDCRDYNAILYKNCIQKDRRWLKRIKRMEDELEEHIKENVRLRELIEDDS